MQRTQTAANRLADDTRAKVEALWAGYRLGRYDLAEFRARAAAVVASANTAGVALADIGLAAEITRQLGRPTRPLGLVPNDVQVDQDRMAEDIDDILDRSDDPEAMLGDWAGSEPLLTVANTVQTGMVRHGIGGWTRVLSGTSCPLCTGWADGVVRSPFVTMVRHVGCDCIQQPVF